MQRKFVLIFFMIALLFTSLNSAFAQAEANADPAQGKKLKSLAFTDSKVKIKFFESKVLKVLATFEDGSVEDVTSKAAFATSNIMMVDIDRENPSVPGKIWGGNEDGVATVTATYEGMTAKITITVLPIKYHYFKLDVFPNENSDFTFGQDVFIMAKVPKKKMLSPKKANGYIYGIIIHGEKTLDIEHTITYEDNQYIYIVGSFTLPKEGNYYAEVSIQQNSQYVPGEVWLGEGKSHEFTIVKYDN